MRDKNRSRTTDLRKSVALRTQNQEEKPLVRNTPIKYFITLLIISVATGIQWLLWPFLSSAPFILYYPSVILASLYGDGLSAIVLSAILAQYIFVPPEFSFKLVWPAQVITQTVFIISALMIRYLTKALSEALARSEQEKKNAETEKNKARESELWLSTTLGSIGDAVIATDHLGRVVFMNPIAEGLTEWSLSDAKGQHLEEIFHIVNQQSRAIVENPVAKVLESGGIVGLANHTVLIGRNGKECAIEDSAAPIRATLGSRVQGVVLVFRDITDKYAQEERLSEAFKQLQLSEARIRSILDNALDAVVGMDSSGLITHWNPQAEKTFGFKVNEAIGQRMSETIIPHRYREAHERGLSHYLASSEGPVLNRRIELVALQRNGTEFPIELSITPVKTSHLTFFAAFIRDISDRKRIEEEKARLLSEVSFERQRLLTMLEQMPAGVILADKNGKLILRNKQIDHILGGFRAANRIEEYGQYEGQKPDGTFYKPEDWPLARSLTKGETVSGEVVEFARFDGSKCTLSISSAPIRDAHGAIVAAVVVHTDITPQKQTEMELKAAVRARDEFLSIASHELKTPLTSLKLQAQMRARKIEKGDTASFSIDHIKKMIESDTRQINRISGLVDDMLDISRISTGKLTFHQEYFDLCELVKEVVERYGPNFDVTGSKLTLACSKPVVGEWDRFRIEQVVVNLLMNSLKYGAGKPVHVMVSQKESWARIVVKDHGIGIPQDAQDRIFKRFERAVSANEVSGLGLGLYIAKQIVELHNGKISVESEPGKGATFIVDIPIQKLPEVAHST